jgi:4-amino-4-deoxy-L-arabinose transferase-like glycosyltransferase
MGGMVTRRFFLFLFLIVLFTYGSAQLPLLGSDEPRYAQVAREMKQSGDYIVPHLGSFAWFEKPVLLYWMMAAFYSILGINEFAARFPSAIAAILAVWTLYRTVKKITDEFQALLTALVLGTTAFFGSFSHAATFDMLLTFTVTASLCLFLLFFTEPENRSYLYGAYLFAGLGILAKGFVALVLIGLPIFAYILWTRDLKNIRRFKPVQGVLLIAIVASIWFLPVTIVYGKRVWYEFVYEHHFVRYTSSYYHRAVSPFFYVPVLLLGTLPWTIIPFIKRPAQDTPERTALYRLAACWFFSTFIFFSLSQSKLPGYILPSTPAFAVFAGGSLAEYLKLKSRRFCVTFLSALLCLPLIGLILVVHVLPEKLNWRESKELSLAALPLLGEKGKLAFYNVYDFTPLFYTDAKVELTPEGYLYNIANDRQLYRYLQGKREAFVVIDNDDLSWMQQAKFWQIEHTITGEEHSIVQLRALSHP